MHSIGIQRVFMHVINITVMMEDKEIDEAVNEVVFYVNGRKVPKINIRIASYIATYS